MAFRAFTGAVSLKRASAGGASGSGGAFRAFTGAVSLKLTPGIVTVRSIKSFRAFTGAVSLKRIRSPPLCDISPTLPRLHGCGLIEAVP